MRDECLWRIAMSVIQVKKNFCAAIFAAVFSGLFCLCSMVALGAAPVSAHEQHSPQGLQISMLVPPSEWWLTSASSNGVATIKVTNSANDGKILEAFAAGYFFNEHGNITKVFRYHGGNWHDLLLPRYSKKSIYIFDSWGAKNSARDKMFLVGHGYGGIGISCHAMIFVYDRAHEKWEEKPFEYNSGLKDSEFKGIWGVADNNGNVKQMVVVGAEERKALFVPLMFKYSSGGSWEKLTFNDVFTYGKFLGISGVADENNNLGQALIIGYVKERDRSELQLVYLYDGKRHKLSAEKFPTPPERREAFFVLSRVWAAADRNHNINQALVLGNWYSSFYPWNPERALVYQRKNGVWSVVLDVPGKVVFEGVWGVADANGEIVKAVVVGASANERGVMQPIVYEYDSADHSWRKSYLDGVKVLDGSLTAVDGAIKVHTGSIDIARRVRVGTGVGGDGSNGSGAIGELLTAGGVVTEGRYPFGASFRKVDGRWFEEPFLRSAEQ
jgi:hypothetical protein